MYLLSPKKRNGKKRKRENKVMQSTYINDNIVTIILTKEFDGVFLYIG